MSKSSTTSAPKIPTKSAWARGPPQNTSSTSASASANASAAASPRSQSPAPAPSNHVQTHSRRPSAVVTLPNKTGVNGWDSQRHKQTSSVSFGSIDDVSGPIAAVAVSSSGNATQATKPEGAKSEGVKSEGAKSEGVKSFGSVPAAVVPVQINGKQSAATTTKPAEAQSTAAQTVTAATTVKKAKPMKMDIHKLFQNPSSSPPTSTPPPSDNSSQQAVASPLLRSAGLPPQPSPGPNGPSQFGNHSFTPFVPGASQRPNNNNSNNNPPRSPAYNRQMSNGNNNGNSSRPPNNNNTAQNGLSSPRLGHPHAQPQNPPPHQPVAGWPGYYYQMGNEPYMPPYAAQGWYMPPQAQGHPMSPMPMSPRNPQQSHQQVPGTPTPSQTHPLPPHPAQHGHSHQNSITSPPPTPSTAAARLNTNANTFVPNRAPIKVTIKNSDGTEMKLDGIKRQSITVSSPSAPVVPVSPSPPAGNTKRSVVRIESPEARLERVAKEEAEKERLQKEKDEKERLEKEKLNKERELKDAEQKRLQQEEEQRKQEAAAEEKRKADELAAKQKAEQEEAERAEQERIKAEMEAAEAAAKEKARLEEEEKAKLEAARIAEEAKARAEQEEAIAKAAATAQTVAAESTTATATEDKEEGEIQAEQQDEVTDTLITVPKKEPASLHIKTLTEGMKKMRPGPLDLSYAKKNNVVAPLPSALATARIIDDLGRVSYPEGVSSPKVELNVGAKDGKFRYDRDFLLQFMSICKEKPDSLPPLDAIGLEPVEQGPGGHPLVRGGSRRGSQTGAPRPVSGANYNSIGKAAPNQFVMGNFGTGGANKMSSEERFNASGNRSASVGSSSGQAPFGRPPQLQRTVSQNSVSADRDRRRSQRGSKRNDSNAVSNQYGSSSYTNNTIGGPTSLLAGESIAPLKPTESAWSARKPQAVDQDSPEMVDRKVKGLLNKLTMEKFDSISDQIITWANKSEKEKDGRTLIQVIRLVFEKATDEATWSEMYARLCRKMMETISTKVQDDGIKTDGKPIAGGQLFRKYLLNRCQEDFERGWITKEATAAAAATKAAEDQAAKDHAAESNNDDEVALYSDEYYAAQKAKRQGLGLIKFIGELFKLQMLTERIMHECVKKLLGNVENPEEEEIESLCKLIGTVGAILDTPKARAHMDVYFSRMNELTKSPNVSSRMQFMLQDVIEMRHNKWVGRNAVVAPTTIAQIHEAAAKETAAKDKEAYQRQISMSRGGSRRGGERGGDFGAQVGPDGWTTAGNGPPRPPPKAGDLSNFGKIGKTAGAPMTFGPSSVFAGKKDNKRESLSRASSSSNMFSMLSQGDAAVSEPPAGKSSRPPSRKASVDFSQTGLPEAPAQRKRLVLAPRTKMSEEATAAPANQSEEEEEQPVSAEPEMSDEDAKKKVEEDSKEFFAVRNIDEAEVYFSNLPPSQHSKLVDKLVSVAVDQLKDPSAILVAALFTRAKEKSLCTPDVFEEAFTSIAEFLDDIVIDAPKAYEFMALMIKGAGLDDERCARISSKSSDNDKLLALLKS